MFYDKQLKVMLTNKEKKVLDNLEELLDSIIDHIYIEQEYGHRKTIDQPKQKRLIVR